jgi:hypothetical protein
MVDEGLFVAGKSNESWLNGEMRALEVWQGSGLVERGNCSVSLMNIKIYSKVLLSPSKHHKTLKFGSTLSYIVGLSEVQYIHS